MADEPQKPPRLHVVKRPPIEVTVPEQTVEQAMAPAFRQLRKWWKAKMEDVPEGTTLSEAMRDVSVLAYAHIAKRLTSTKTPQRVKDQLAMAIGPKFGVQVMGQLGGERPDEPSAGRSVLEDYRGKTPA